MGTPNENKELVKEMAALRKEVKEDREDRHRFALRFAEMATSLNTIDQRGCMVGEKRVANLEIAVDKKLEDVYRVRREDKQHFDSRLDGFRNLNAIGTLIAGAIAGIMAWWAKG